jgi:carbamoyltransferase
MKFRLLFITAFGKETGVPILLNTSFNENEPSVCHPQEAASCFLKNSIDVLVIGPYMVTGS